MTLPDVQRTPDTREVDIKRVGVTGIKLPITLLRKDDEHNVKVDHPLQETVGVFELSCSLPAAVKGTHMSRFTEVLMAHLDANGLFSCRDLQKLAYELAKKLQATEVLLKLRVDYFMRQDSPVTEKKGVAPLIGLLEVELSQIQQEESSGYANVDPKEPEWVMETRTGIEIDGKTCCPCSKEISDFDETTGRGKGAHAQRSHIKMLVNHRPENTIYFENLAKIAWRAFSIPCYPVLKRPDERHVTMGAYDNPKFVEDVVRDVAVQLRAFPIVYGFQVRVENDESIHYHNAFAEVEE